MKATKELRERAESYGTAHLSDIELAALIGYKPKPNEALVSSEFIKHVHELSNRFRAADFDLAMKVQSSRQLFDYITTRHTLQNLFVEHFYVIALNRQNKVIKSIKISEGGLDACLVDPRVIFTQLLSIKGCTTFALFHNHPSGNLTPSQQDINITKKLKEGGKLLDLHLLDHIIIGGNNFNTYLSLGDEGHL
jgi:DNA repair protein RadC